MREHFGQFGAAVAVTVKLVARAKDCSVRADEGVALRADDFGWQRPAFELGQLGLVIEQIELAGSAGHEEVNHRLRFRCEVRRPRDEAAGWLGGSSRLMHRGRKERRSGDFAESDAAFVEEVAAGNRLTWRGEFLACTELHG